MTGTANRQSWEDWGAVDPIYAILTDPQYRLGGGDVAAFLASGEAIIRYLMAECDRLGLCENRGTALDFGCGVGRLTVPLTEYFDGVVGIDIASSMIARARAMHGDRCQFAVHHGEDLSIYPSKSFDLVVCLLVLQHLPTRSAMEHYMAEFVRILRPGGAVALQLPATVPSAPPVPPWRTKEGVRRRAGIELRRWGVSPQILYERLGWAPEMTMVALPDADARAVIASAGGEVRFSTAPDVDPGGTESRIYFVTRR